MASSFKAFKFIHSDPKPPPPPPKDPIYLQRQLNRSQGSLLSPEASPQLPPASPLSPSVQYAIRRTNSPSPFSSPDNNHMSQSTTSLVQQQQPMTQQDPTTSSNRQTQMSFGSKKALSFLKFNKRSPRSPPLDDPDQPPREDEGISLPWNFQHNMHVDEGYGGLPPSWSTSLATAGFTEDEILAIQARRAGARSPPDLRYLYTDRPSSPSSYAPTPPTSFPVPILANPTPRSTSLPRLVPLPPDPSGRPPIPVPVLTPSKSNGSLRSTATSKSNRVPRKPAPLTDDLLAGSGMVGHGGKGHKANQASSSTVGYSTDSHAVTSSSNHSQPLTNASTSSLSTRTKTEEETRGVESSLDAPIKSNGKEKKSIWGTLSRARSTKDLNANPAASSSTPNLSLFSNPGANASTSSHTRDPSAPLLGTSGAGAGGSGLLAGGGLAPSASTSNLQLNNPLSPSPLSPLPSWKAGASSLAAAGSSIVGFAKSSAGKGISRMRGAGGSLNKGTKSSSSGAGGAGGVGGMGENGGGGTGEGEVEVGEMEADMKSPMSNETFLVGRETMDLTRPPVWELYGTSNGGGGLGVAGDGQGGRSANPSMYDITSPPPDDQQFAMAQDNGSGVSFGSVGETTARPAEHGQGGHSRKSSVTSLHRQFSKSRSQGSLRSQRSQGSSKEGNQGTQRPTRLGQHKHSGSVTSLDSIPEASPAPGAVLGMGATRKGPAAASSFANLGAGGNVPGNTISVISSSSNASTISAGSVGTVVPPSVQHKQSGSVASATLSSPDSSPRKPLGMAGRSTTAPPRLSLHQNSDTLSSWSEALLTGISLTGSWEEEISKGLGVTLDAGGQGRRSPLGDSSPLLGKEAPMSAPASGRAFQAQQRQAAQQRQQREQQQQRSQPGSTANSATNSTLHSRAASGNVTTPSRPIRKPGQVLPSSKPPPKAPAPAPPIGLSGSASSSSSSLAQQFNFKAQPAVAKVGVATASASSSRPSTAGSMGASRQSPMTSEPPVRLPAVPTPYSPFGTSAKPLPSPLPLGPKALPTPTATAMPNPPAAEGLLSPPPPTSWKSPTGPGGVMSPASSTGPDSAQLWNEIEQMMDPGMISNVPGLRLSVALPPGAKDVLKSAGIGGGFGGGAGPGAGQGLEPPIPVQAASVVPPQIQKEMRTVGDLVGESPPGSPEDEDEDEGSDESDYGDEDPYEGVVEKVIAKPIEPLALRMHGRAPSRDQGPIGGGGGRRMMSREREELLMADDKSPNRDSTRSSTSTITVTAMQAAKIVRNVSVARRAGAYVIDKRSPGPSPIPSPAPGARMATPPMGAEPKQTPSPPSGGSSEESGSSGSPLLEHPTPTTTDGGLNSPLFYYLDGTQTPSPNPDRMFEQRDTLPRRMASEKEESELAYESDYDEQEVDYPDTTLRAQMASAGGPTPSRPTIIISDAPASEGGLRTATTASNATPLSPFQLYRGWLSDVVAPLQEFIDETVDPRDHYLDLNEIAEGESGSVFSAQLNPENASKLKLPPLIKAQDTDEIINGQLKLVAIKSIAIVPSGSPKLDDLQKELSLMRGLWHENVLGMDAVYVDLVEDSLWVRMELMERSLADIIGLVEEGLMLQDRIIARFASDVLLALDYLARHNIGHRDVRSDNLLINKHGVLQLADFSNAVQVTTQNPMRDDPVGVAFWQAPEIRRGPYNALKVDVWSLGATVWEMAQTEPPFADTQQFADRWPQLDQPELYSRAFHDFLWRCSEPAETRPSATELLKSTFVNNASGRPVIVQLLSQCMAIEKVLQERNDAS